MQIYQFIIHNTKILLSCLADGLHYIRKTYWVIQGDSCFMNSAPTTFLACDTDSTCILLVEVVSRIPVASEVPKMHIAQMWIPDTTYAYHNRSKLSYHFCYARNKHNIETLLSLIKNSNEYLTHQVWNWHILQKHVCVT